MDMQDVHYHLGVEGISGLIMNSNHKLIVGEDKGRDPAAYELEHFREKAYTGPDGQQLIIPARAMKKTFINACRFLPEKPKGVSFKSYGPFIEAATIFPVDFELDATLDQLIPFTNVVSLNPSLGPKSPRGPRTRPMLPTPWRAHGEMLVIDPILTLDVLQRIAERAGKQCGLLDGRAIDFGRCFITVKAMAKRAAA
jgi:hypothetical protein